MALHHLWQPWQTKIYTIIYCDCRNTSHFDRDQIAFWSWAGSTLVRYMQGFFKIEYLGFKIMSIPLQKTLINIQTKKKQMYPFLWALCTGLDFSSCPAVLGTQFHLGIINTGMPMKQLWEDQDASEAINQLCPSVLLQGWARRNPCSRSYGATRQFFSNFLKKIAHRQHDSN